MSSGPFGINLETCEVSEWGPSAGCTSIMVLDYLFRV